MFGTRCPPGAFPTPTVRLAPAPAASTLFDGGVAQSIIGTTAYAYWDSSIYTEVGLYWTPAHGFLIAMGTDEGPGPISGVAPYLRVAYQKDYGDQNFEVGAFGFFPAPSRRRQHDGQVGFLFRPGDRRLLSVHGRRLRHLHDQCALHL